MVTLGFRNLFNPYSFKKAKGVTIIELLVGTSVFLGVSFGAYQVYTKSTQKAEQSQKQAKYSRGLKTFMERFRHEVENSVQLPNAQSTSLKITRPSNCDYGDEVGITELSWGMIPYPGFAKSDFTTSLAPFNPVDKTVDDTGAHGNDGILMVFIPEDSTVNFLAYSDIAAQILEPSNGDTLQVAGTVKNLEVGDFAVVSDAVRKELVRVTGKTVSGSNTEIEHSSAKSIWNNNFTNGMAAAGSAVGQPVIYKVSLATYALDKDSETLMKDDHTWDDNFNPTAKTFGTKGLKLKWDPVASGISKFQVIYVVGDSTTEKEIRKPQIGMPTKTYDDCSVSGAKPNCGCENELGNPKLKTVKAIVSFSKPSNDPNAPKTVADSTVEAFNPTILKKGLPFMSIDHAGCTTNGQPLYSTLADGTSNPSCASIYCLCSDRYLDSLCDPSTEPNHCCGSTRTWNGNRCVSNNPGNGNGGNNDNDGSYGGGGTG